MMHGRVTRAMRSTAGAMAVLMASASIAQTPPPAPAASSATPDAARVAAARTLVGTLHIEQQLRAQQAQAPADAEMALDRMVPAQIAMRAQLADPPGYAKARAEAIRLIVEDRQRTAEETIPMMVEAEVRRFAGHYSVEELRGLEAFYRSPLGQRVIAEQPRIATENVQFQQNVLSPVLTAHSAALVPKLAAAMGPALRAGGTPSPAAVAPAPPQGKKK